MRAAQLVQQAQGGISRKRSKGAVGLLQHLARRSTPSTATQLIEHDRLVVAASGSRWEFVGPQGLVGVDLRPKLKANDGMALCIVRPGHRHAGNRERHS